MRHWYYVENGEQKGPLGEAQLVQLFQSGTLTPQTMVWTSELQDWTEAQQVEGLLPQELHPPPPPIAPAGRIPAPASPTFVPSGPQVRPWVRYWARTIDLYLFGLISGSIIVFIHEPLLEETPDALLGIILTSACVFVEPVLLSSWGTTPGKALLNVRLRKANASTPSYGEALTRSLHVWVRGLGLGLPFIALVTLITAYNRLTKDGLTSWDKHGDFRVQHKLVGAGRIVVTVLLLIGFGLLVVLGETNDVVTQRGDEFGGWREGQF